MRAKIKEYKTSTLAKLCFKFHKMGINMLFTSIIPKTLVCYKEVHM